MNCQSRSIGSDVTGPHEVLLYRSRPSCPPDLVLLDILRSSERENRNNRLSGILYYDRECFLQRIDGPRAMIERLWGNLRRDDRHGVLWHAWLAAAGAAIPASLPMGYVGTQQISKFGIDPCVFQPRQTPDIEGRRLIADLMERLAREYYPSCFKKTCVEV